MGKRDIQVDAYIAKSQPFAQPILNHIRELVHQVVPEVEESIKWSFPHFNYKGTLCSMASFKAHCSLGFWKASLLKDPKGFINLKEDQGMGSFGKISSLKDLPPDSVLKQFLKQAARLNEEGVKVPAKKTIKEKKELIEPEYFLKALAKNKKAEACWDQFSYSHRKEYLEWITDAKREETRDKRILTALEWMAEGKGRNWQYESKSSKK
jgi:uncharacterized protein YdeI (YjbR/CyaY-like superfamily)